MASINYNNINNEIKRLVQYFDNMSWNLFNMVYEDLEKYKAKVNIDRENRTMLITCDDFEITYYTNNEYFSIESFVSKKHFSDNQPLIITHKIYNDGKHILDIRDSSFSSTCISNSLNKDLEKTKKSLNKIGNYYSCWYINNTKDNDTKEVKAC